MAMNGHNGSISDLLRTYSEALICDIKFSFSNSKILFVFFTCIPASWILLSPVVNLISFDVDERSSGGIPGLCIPLFRSGSGSVGCLVLS